MKKLLLTIATILLLAGCSLPRWTTIDAGADKEKIIQQHFPELYEKAQRGEVELHELKTRQQKDGSIKYQISYKELTEDQEWEDFLVWQIIYGSQY